MFREEADAGAGECACLRNRAEQVRWQERKNTFVMRVFHLAHWQATGRLTCALSSARYGAYTYEVVFVSVNIWRAGNLVLQPIPGGGKH